jgi:hypothetical protein
MIGFFAARATCLHEKHTLCNSKRIAGKTFIHEALGSGDDWFFRSASSAVYMGRT